MSLVLDYKTVLEELVKRDVQFTILGGFAAIAHGVVRVTMDLDLSINLNPRDLEKTWDSLNEMGFQIRQPIRKEEFTSPEKLLALGHDKNVKAISFFHPQKPFLVIDILFDRNFQISEGKRVEIELFGKTYQVPTIDQLIQLKKEAGRPKDLEDIRELTKIKKTKKI